VRLVPLSASHHAALCAIGLEPALWAMTTIRVQTPEDMRRYIQAALDAQAAGTALAFMLALPHTDTVVGTTRYHSIVAAHRRLEIGFTWVGLPWQRTPINTEAKYLLLRQAFEGYGCQRVEFKADIANEPSCRSLQRIGATREGVLRSYMVSPHRGSRDVALFSIVAAEWPRVKAGLERRLAGGRGEPR
jgi:RimJ/RimL family protein N-acetyltransferase